MKKISSLAAFTVAVILFQSCVKDKLVVSRTYYEPVYKSKQEVLQHVKSNTPQPLRQTGKIFLFGKYLFINELNKGVHVIDNGNPAAPVNVAFIDIPGNVDLAVKNNTLYADIYSDMLVIDIADPKNVVMKKVVPSVFPEREYGGSFINDTSRYIVDWIKKEVKEEQPIVDDTKIIYTTDVFNAPGANYSSASSTKAIGIAGSLSRFTIVNNYLYTVSKNWLSAYNITQPEEPVNENASSVNMTVETIYPLNDKLFVGGQTGMYIFDITNPATPVQQGIFSHACFNDPVIADEEHAFVTLKATTNTSPCWGTSIAQRNELDIVDIKLIQQPLLVKIYDMVSPAGLSKDGDHLFICDGAGGLKVYDASDVTNLNLIKQVAGIEPHDVICYNGNAIVVAKQGIFQYNYSNINNITLTSKISIEN